ncbi:MAG: DUF3352 domain-containing protein [Gemmataceae bacterium]|nr:DUF3352 domain-containing protein [Gemmataceae bacterium]MDW8267407.1 hypothetical protein [Gemmataceae bacterium]
MRQRYLVAFACCSLWAAVPLAARAEPYFPDQAHLVLFVHEPKRLVETFLRLEPVVALNKLQAIQELADSTNARRFLQLVAYLEKELQAPWPRLLDQLRGFTLGVKFGSKNHAVLVVEGRDQALMQKFVRLALEVVEQELARQEIKLTTQRRSYRGVETIEIGPEVRLAVMGSILLIANSEEGLKAAINSGLDTNRSFAGVRGMSEAKQLLVDKARNEPLVWLWFNLDVARQAPNAKEVFELPRNLALTTVLLGGWLDVAKRSPWVAAGLFHDEHDQGDRLRLLLAMPRGRDGLHEALTLHVPPPGQVAARMPLKPKGALYSTSYYLDLGQLWEQRTKLFTEKQAKDFEEFNKNSGRFLLGNSISKLLTQAGPQQRFVVAHQVDTGYNRKPAQRLPAFGFVISMRQPDEFSRSMDTILRSAALLGGLSGQLKLVEEQLGEVKLVGYRFLEDKVLANDPNGLRFNFSPCFARVGDQFLISSTIELGQELVRQLRRESLLAQKLDDRTTVRTCVFADGAVDFLKSVEDQLLAQTILSQALAPGEAQEQVKLFIEIVQKLGYLLTEVRYGQNDFVYDVQLHVSK